MWEVVYLPEAVAERAELPARDRVAVDNAVAKLEAMGPALPLSALEQRGGLE
jgi:hypothetical protein